MVNEDFYLQEPDDEEVCPQCGEQIPCGNSCDTID